MKSTARDFRALLANGRRGHERSAGRSGPVVHVARRLRLRRDAGRPAVLVNVLTEESTVSPITVVINLKAPAIEK